MSKTPLILTGALAFTLLAAPLLKADSTPQQVRTLSVSGQGDVKGAPNEAVLSAGVVTSAKTAGAALAANTRAMNAVFATLKKAGIPDKSMQTSDFGVTPQYPPGRDESDGSKIVGYQVTNNVIVVVDDLSKLGGTLDALVASGANSMGGISFGIRDPKPMLAQARTAAVQDAIARAQTIAKAAGVTLGSIISIQEGGSDYAPMTTVAGMMRASSAPVPVAAGQQTISANVSITWALR